MTTKKNDCGYIYIVHVTGTNKYKIEFTLNHAEAILRQCNITQLPYPLELVKSVLVNNVAALKKRLHQKFAKYKKDNESFEFTEKNVDQVINLLKEYECQQQTSQPKSSKSSNDDSSGAAVFIGILIAVGMGFNTATSGESKPAYNHESATPIEKQLKYNFDVCTDGKAGNDEHLNCQRIVTEYQNKFAK